MNKENLMDWIKIVLDVDTGLEDCFAIGYRFAEDILLWKISSSGKVPTGFLRHF
ncbi:MAG: hypothetical protein OXC97_02690 [Candidatus Dadabacteria bacterium]|nr:hypothetical protein [Candidatus Dadabacteria bacterium]